MYAPGASDDLRARGLYEVHRSRSGVVYRWSMPQAFFHPPPGAHQLQLKVRSIASTPQTVTLLVGGRTVESVTLRDQSWVTLSPNLQPATDGPLWVEMRVDPSWRPPGTARPLGVQTRDLKWNP